MFKNKMIASVLALSVALAGIAQEKIDYQKIFKQYANDTLLPTDERLKEMPSKTLTAEDVLNKKIIWKVPYKELSTVNYTGFDASKITKLPAKGIYPRLITSPSEFSDIKSRLENSKIGKRLLALSATELQQMRNGAGQIGKYYQAFQQKNVIDEKMLKPNQDFSNLLAIQALLAQINGDKALLETTATIAANYLKSILKHIEEEPFVIGRELMAKEEIFGGGKNAKLFDFTAAGMNEQDRKEISDLIARQIKGRFTPGMELPPHWRRWNHVPMDAPTFGLTALAVEENKNYDSRIVNLTSEVADDYLTYAFSPEGMSTEGISYTFGPFESQLNFMVAILRRGGKNLFLHPHLRAITDWLIYTLGPNPDVLWTSHGDIGSISEFPWIQAMILKYFHPTDAKIDYLFANTLYQDITKLPDVTAFVYCTDPSKTREQYNGVPPVNMPLTFFSPMRGSLIARNKWDKNGLCFMFEARQDTYFPSHDHSDRGNFSLFANGRTWVSDGWRSTESKYHAVITIDNHGQGYFATPATWINYFDSPQATFGVVDYKYCFDWRWLKSPVADGLLGKPLAKQWETGVYANTVKNLKSYYPNVKPERDPLRKVAEFYSGNLATNPLFWKEDSWVMRMENYPVAYAFRTAGLVKGKHEYVLIVDDIKKDNQERLYEFAMPMPLDVELVNIKQLVSFTQGSGALNIGFNEFSDFRTQGDYDMILGDKRMSRNMQEVDNQIGGVLRAGKFTPKKGDPQLLVRVLNRTDAPEPNIEPVPRLETFEHLKTENMHQFYMRTMELGKRLVIPSRSTEPNFKVLIFPYLHGEETPKTFWNADRTQLTVTWSDQKDVFFFTKGKDNRTRTKLVRDGNVVFDL